MPSDPHHERRAASPALALIEQLDRDVARTRRLLERLPDDSMDWRPYPQGFSLGELATHLARLPHWGAHIVRRASHDLAAGGQPRPPAVSRADVLDLFDRHIAELRDTLLACSDADLSAAWTLRRSDTVIETMSRAEAVERYVLHHLIHHRGQLTVYYRLLGVPVTPLYGPTADGAVS